ncbi:hypothetical protein RB195_019600 [Necator americanus]|uniref:Uncharacterized protein n=1 Tax=Necator americanus TaxID=51031 RepID=A0ABR1CFZ5_NECAM
MEPRVSEFHVPCFGVSFDINAKNPHDIKTTRKVINIARSVDGPAKVVNENGINTKMSSGIEQAHTAKTRLNSGSTLTKLRLEPNCSPKATVIGSPSDLLNSE